ncbi:MAG: hypothetical protein ACTSQO_01350 [Candidatus Helarchaeota archaeon]
MTPSASIPSTLLKDFGTVFLIMLKGGNRKKNVRKVDGTCIKSNRELLWKNSGKILK